MGCELHAAMVSCPLTARRYPIIDRVPSPAIDVATGTTVKVLHPHDTEGLSHEEEKDGAHSVPAEPYGNARQLERSCPEENVGWCLLCDGPIRSAQDLIPNTNTLNCPEGLKLESRLR